MNLTANQNLSDEPAIARSPTVANCGTIDAEGFDELFFLCRHDGTFTIAVYDPVYCGFTVYKTVSTVESACRLATLIHDRHVDMGCPAPAMH